MLTRKSIVLVSLGLTVPLSSACDELVCGEGTIERGGACVLADSQPPNNDFCDVGTHLDPSGSQGCIPDYEPTVCGPNTISQYNEETGVTECIGTGGAMGCDGVFVCETPDANKLTVCGQLIDTETNQPIRIGEGSAAPCTAASDTGPCALEVNFYDALEFAQNPMGATPLQPDSTVIDQCGRFKGHNIPVPGLGFLGIGFDDPMGSGANNYVLAGVALAASSGLKVTDFRGYVVSTATDAKWTTSAGNPFPNGQTFNERGAYLGIHLRGDTPVAGVQITVADTTVPASDYYFDDTEAFVRSSIGTANVTGVNGTGIVVDSDLVNHGATGGLDSMCMWVANLAKSIPGVILVQERHAQNSQGEPCE